MNNKLSPYTKFLHACKTGDDKAVLSYLKNPLFNATSLFYAGEYTQKVALNEKVVVRVRATALMLALLNFKAKKTPNAAAVLRVLLDNRAQIRANPVLAVQISSYYREARKNKCETTQNRYSLADLVRLNYQKLAGRTIPFGLEQFLTTNPKLLALLKERIKKFEKKNSPQKITTSSKGAFQKKVVQKKNHQKIK